MKVGDATLNTSVTRYERSVRITIKAPPSAATAHLISLVLTFLRYKPTGSSMALTTLDRPAFSHCNNFMVVMLLIVSNAFSATLDSAKCSCWNCGAKTRSNLAKTLNRTATNTTSITNDIVLRYRITPNATTNNNKVENI